jgi:hypothetical protein
MGCTSSVRRLTSTNVPLDRKLGTHTNRTFSPLGPAQANIADESRSS